MSTAPRRIAFAAASALAAPSGPVLVAVAVAVILALGSGCRSPSSPGPGSVGPIATADAPSSDAGGSIEAAALALLPVDGWQGNRILRQRVRVEWPSGGESFDAVLQHRPGELALIGLGPMNLVGFRLALVGGEGGGRIEFENRSGRALPFSPTHILADVQRVFYPWLAEPWPTDQDDCRRACERSGRQAGVAVWERSAEGRLEERRFAIPGRLEAGEVRIRYLEWRGEPVHPVRVELDNGWFGYRLTIETLESTPIPAR